MATPRQRKESCGINVDNTKTKSLIVGLKQNMMLVDGKDIENVGDQLYQLQAQ